MISFEISKHIQFSYFSAKIMIKIFINKQDYLWFFEKSKKNQIIIKYLKISLKEKMILFCFSEKF